jgi:hypothetical protein
MTLPRPQQRLRARQSYVFDVIREEAAYRSSHRQESIPPTDQEAQPREGSIENLGSAAAKSSSSATPNCSLSSLRLAHLLSAGVATTCAIFRRECMSYRAVLEQARLCGGGRLAGRSEKSSRAALHAPYRRCALEGPVGKNEIKDARPTAVRQSGAQDKHDEHAGARG